MLKLSLFILLACNLLSSSKIPIEQSSLYFQLSEQTPKNLYASKRNTFKKERKLHFQSKNGIPKNLSKKSRKEIAKMVAEIVSKKERNSNNSKSQKTKKMNRKAFEIKDAVNTAENVLNFFPRSMGIPLNNWQDKLSTLGGQGLLAASVIKTITDLKNYKQMEERFNFRVRSRNLYLNTLNTDRRKLSEINTSMNGKTQIIEDKIIELNKFFSNSMDYEE